ncbi:DUF4342 domain-containing protein [Ancrocorticia populi]|uniref:DUF4342 domain-containing protein n=1 Tax=Ancrocorticia populi TaxID=2175228 RepID=A0A2V1KCI4_9ACTO|nr:DUF4342 domain-containing protein [Ancrocorticia populi]PWF27217.1 hypothetical protein DD236_02115 [Ancrocorticia populi]
MANNEGTDGGKHEGRWSEKIEIGSEQVLDAIKNLIKETNIRKITIKNSSGKRLLTVPATAGAAVGGVAVLAAPMISAILAITALLTNVTLEIERVETVDGEVTEDDETDEEGLGLS